VNNNNNLYFFSIKYCCIIIIKKKNMASEDFLHYNKMQNRPTKVAARDL
jgi:hypothetical protein